MTLAITEIVEPAIDAQFVRYGETAVYNGQSVTAIIDRSGGRSTRSGGGRSKRAVMSIRRSEYPDEPAPATKAQFDGKTWRFVELDDGHPVLWSVTVETAITSNPRR